jgi:hypothetical protein
LAQGATQHKLGYFDAGFRPGSAEFRGLQDEINLSVQIVVGSAWKK